MSRYLSAEVRQLVAARADYLCEYCLIAEDDTFFGCEVDHVISLKHGGSSEVDNLAYACVFCNRQKGSDIGSISLESGEFSRFFNPRTDRWSDHFRLTGNSIQPLTLIGEVTARILNFNTADRILERRALQEANKYPNQAALIRIGK
ncbi:MAG TPA: HNH endonuclease signature motif containing protein [Pyrinomonadaceae bacterium]|nr:HNH endonuclease signature motif containing protein [Pyrinomonadaceae bacterium]